MASWSEVRGGVATPHPGWFGSVDGVCRSWRRTATAASGAVCPGEHDRVQSVQQRLAGLAVPVRDEREGSGRSRVARSRRRPAGPTVSASSSSAAFTVGSCPSSPYQLHLRVSGGEEVEQFEGAGFVLGGTPHAEVRSGEQRRVVRGFRQRSDVPIALKFGRGILDRGGQGTGRSTSIGAMPEMNPCVWSKSLFVGTLPSA